MITGAVKLVYLPIAARERNGNFRKVIVGVVVVSFELVTARNLETSKKREKISNKFLFHVRLGELERKNAETTAAQFL